MDVSQARAFAREWVRCWNDRDLAAILSHYSDDCVFHSPRIRLVTGLDQDRISGKSALEAYWREALERSRDLYFDLDQILVGSDALTILYTNQRSESVAETFVFDGAGRVRLSVATYA